LIVSYISKDMLVILGSAIAFVYLNEYNNTKENMGAVSSVLVAATGAVGAGVGGYFIGKAVDPSYRPPQDTNIDSASWLDKLRDKTFPGLFGSETGKVLSLLEKRQKMSVLELIGIGKPSVVGEVQQNVKCPDGEFLKPQYAYKTGRYTCKAGLSLKTCCGALPTFSVPSQVDGDMWNSYLQTLDDVAAGDEATGIPCWARRGETVINPVDKSCNNCGIGRHQKSPGHTAACKASPPDTLDTVEDGLKWAQENCCDAD
jgi:hypothetical protein